MGNGWGGARPGAGRKARAQKFAGPIAAAEQAIVDQLPQIVGNLLMLANGGWEEISEHYEPAGLVLVDDYAQNAEGQSYKVKRLAFPDLPPDQMVLVKRVRSVAAPDRIANIYLVDRILGKPVQAIEASGPEGGSIPVELFQASLKRIYGEPEDEQ